jgi:hypothetical protein
MRRWINECVHTPPASYSNAAVVFRKAIAHTTRRKKEKEENHGSFDNVIMGEERSHLILEAAQAGMQVRPK